MIDYAFTAFVLAGGFIIGLIVGIVRRHGLAGTLLDIVVGGVAAIVFVFLWFYGLGAIPGVLETVNRVGRQYPYVGGAISLVTLLTPAIGALIGLWIVSRARAQSRTA